METQKKRGTASLLVPRIEAFALPKPVERSNARPTPICTSCALMYGWENIRQTSAVNIIRIHLWLTRKQACNPYMESLHKGCYEKTHPEDIHNCYVTDWFKESCEVSIRQEQSVVQTPFLCCILSHPSTSISRGIGVGKYTCHCHQHVFYEIRRK